MRADSPLAAFCAPLARSAVCVARELAAGLALVALLLAPVGCLNIAPGGDGGDTLDDLSKAAGLFISEDENGAIIAARNEAGDAFFVFGQRSGNDIERVDSLLYRDKNGAQSSIIFGEDGWPVQVNGPAGERADIEYTEKTDTRLTAEVVVFNSDAEVIDAFPVVIDLEETAAEIAALVERVTGRDVTTIDIDDGGITAKSLTHQTRITIFSPLFAVVAGLGGVIASMIIVLGQMLSAIVETISAVAESIVLVIFTPFFAIAEIMGATITNVRLVPLAGVIDVPDEQYQRF